MHASMTTRASLNSSAINSIEIAIPDIEYQKPIGRILKRLDDKIDLNRRTNHTLEQIAQTLFKKYFVDDIDPENLPEGWRWGRLGEVCENFDSKRIPLSSMQRDKRKGIYPYYGAASLMGFVDDYIFEGVHILLGEDGSVIDERGFPILQYVWGKFWVNNHAHVLIGKSYFSTNHLYMTLLNTSVTHLVTGAVQPKINQGNLNNLEVLIPDEKACLKFSKEIDSLFELKKNNIDEIKNLEKVRDSLLPKLMSGEIELNIAEKELAEL
jgi:type I restriction enzyme S subunit